MVKLRHFNHDLQEHPVQLLPQHQLLLLHVHLEVLLRPHRVVHQVVRRVVHEPQVLLLDPVVLRVLYLSEEQ